MENNEILQSFFTTVDHGKSVLANYSETKWDLILEDTYWLGKWGVVLFIATVGWYSVLN